MHEVRSARVLALNPFIDDLCNEHRILKDNVVPAGIIDSSRNYPKHCMGFSPRHGVWANNCGSDLVRGGDGTVYVFGNNLRVPSGVSYMLENRNVIKRVLPLLFQNHDVRPVSEYPTALGEIGAALAHAGDGDLASEPKDTEQTIRRMRGGD